MKVVILAGGVGSRLSEETRLIPKPMVEIGGNPILWHIMKSYSYYGFNEFIICCGYKGHMVKEYFADYYLHRSDITFDFTDNNNMIVHNNVAEPWKVTLVDTGLNTQTGARIKKVQKYIGAEPFMLTYGDGVSDVNIQDIELSEAVALDSILVPVFMFDRYGKNLMKLLIILANGKLLLTMNILIC